jgi:hypothetical protein
MTVIVWTRSLIFKSSIFKKEKKNRRKSPRIHNSDRQTKQVKHENKHTLTLLLTQKQVSLSPTFFIVVYHFSCTILKLPVAVHNQHFDCCSQYPSSSVIYSYNIILFNASNWCILEIRLHMPCFQYRLITKTISWMVRCSKLIPAFSRRPLIGI